MASKMVVFPGTGIAGDQIEPVLPQLFHGKGHRPGIGAKGGQGQVEWSHTSSSSQISRDQPLQQPGLLRAQRCTVLLFIQSCKQLHRGAALRLLLGGDLPEGAGAGIVVPQLRMFG